MKRSVIFFVAILAIFGSGFTQNLYGASSQEDSLYDSFLQKYLGIYYQGVKRKKNGEITWEYDGQPFINFIVADRTKEGLIDLLLDDNQPINDKVKDTIIAVAKKIDPEAQIGDPRITRGPKRTFWQYFLENDASSRSPKMQKVTEIALESGAYTPSLADLKYTIEKIAGGWAIEEDSLESFLLLLKYAPEKIVADMDGWVSLNEDKIMGGLDYYDKVRDALTKRMGFFTQERNSRSLSSSSSSNSNQKQYQYYDEEALSKEAMEESKREFEEQKKQDPKKPTFMLPKNLANAIGIKQVQLDVNHEEPIEVASFEEIYEEDADGGVLKLKLTFTNVNNKWHYAFYFPNDQVIAIGKEDPVSRQNIVRIIDVELKKDGDTYTLGEN